MIDIKIISLEKDIKKRNFLLKKLIQRNISHEVVNAINGKELTAKEYFDKFQCNNTKLFGRKFLTPSELGCFLSHQKALFNFSKSKSEWLIVLEDDVDIISPERLEKLRKVSKNLSRSDIYILGGQDGLNSFNRIIFSKENKNNFRRIKFKTYRWIYRTCCYMVHKTIALEILNLMNKKRFILDDWAFILKHTNTKSIYFNKIFSHPIEITSSNIESERKFLTEK